MENQARLIINYLKPNVEQYFKVPDKGNSNENLAGFMVLLLQILDHESPSYSGDQQHTYTRLQNELTFLHTFLGDTPFGCIDREDIKNVLVEFKSLANEAGNFVYSFVSASSDVMRNDNFDGGIHSLLGKIDALNANIKELCFQEIHETTPSSCSILRSAFIIESLLDDIQSLMNGLVGVAFDDDIKDLMNTLVEELNFSKTFVKDVENELTESLVDATYEAEYLINSYTVGLVPSWYLNLRLPVVIQKIKLARTRLEGFIELQDVENVSDSAWDVSSKEFTNPEAVLDVIGFDDVTEKILEDLTGKSASLQIISIHEMPGSGKTTYFPNDGNGSRILFTSRIKASAPCIIHSVPALSELQCYDLLEKKIFKNEPCPPVLSSIAKGIASKCHGLPLAVVVVAGILASLELDETTWKNIKGNLDSYIDDSGIRILELSYEHLPNQLKPCFLYLGAFSRNEEIVTEKLVPMWIAQGFVHEEHIAEQYLLDLINRSLLVIAKRRSDGRIKSCSFHDLLHDMCLKSGKKENFMKTIDVLSPVYQKCSHLALYPLLSNTCSISAPHCRSISGFIPYLGHSVAEMPLLRVINVFELSKNNFMDVMRRICGLIHLRYLYSEHGMPQEICKLVNLEYLHLDTQSTVYAPSAILKMVKLRHIRITKEVVFDKKCDLSQITNKIKSLSRVCIKTQEEEKILKCSPEIQKFKCICNGLFPDLTTFKVLESLNVVIFNIPLRVGLTEITFPSKLKRLTLSGTCFQWEETWVIGTLPNLHVLKLLRDAFVGEEWETKDGEFQELKFLKLSGITSLKNWTVFDNPFPQLRCLVLKDVSMEIPIKFSEIENLHTIEARNCEEVVYTSAWQIEEEIQDYSPDFKILADKVKVSQSEEGGGGELLVKDGRLDFDKEELGRVIELSIAEEDDKGKKIIDDASQLEDGEVLANALQDSLDMEDSLPGAPPFDFGSFFPPYPFYHFPKYRICAGCNSKFVQGRSFNCMGSVWHPECFRCHACDRPIFDIQFAIFDNRPYHNSCSRNSEISRCYVCKNLMYADAVDGRIRSLVHPFWLQRYCPSHETDGTPRCATCEKLEAIETTHLALDDGRNSCLECLESSIMDTEDCQSLYLEIRDFFEGLNMKLEQQFPLILVKSQALGGVTEGYKISRSGHCLFTQQAGGVTTTNSSSEPNGLASERGLTAILVLYGCPRLWTGKTIAHFVMKSWLWFQGYSNFGPGVGEGICQILSHMWLDAEIDAGFSKKGKRSEFEEKLGKYLKFMIESDTTARGDGFREGMKAVEEYGLTKTLDHIRLTGAFLC